jgi:hypothetical protein
MSGGFTAPLEATMGIDYQFPIRRASTRGQLVGEGAFRILILRKTKGVEP